MNPPFYILYLFKDAAFQTVLPSGILSSAVLEIPSKMTNAKKEI